MRFFFTSTASVLILSGCATVGSYQQECETKYQAFPDMVNCLNSSVHSDSRMAGSPLIKLYMLKAEQLSKKVSNSEMSEIDARVELQQTYVGLKQQSDIQQAANIAAYSQMQNAIKQNNNNIVNGYKVPQPTFQPLPTPTNCTTQFMPNGYAFTNCNK